MATHQNNRQLFAISLLVLELIVIVVYSVFVRTEIHNDAEANANYYPMYQNVNVMMLIGFGFLMTFVKNHSWSALAYTFFINAVIVQLYIPLSSLWEKVFEGNWDQIIELKEKSFTAASYSVAAILISFGGVLGRVGPLELLIMGFIEIIGYSLNEQLVYDRLGIFDAGGSTAIHTFGAYFGIAASLVLGDAVKPQSKPHSNYNSNIFGMIGTLFLWMFWPSFNSGFFPEHPYEKSLIITNTILSLTGSCLGTFIMTALLRHKFEMEDILNASLAGGVMIGTASGILVNPGTALCIGVFAGIISTLGFRYLQGKLQTWIGLNDTCGINNLHGIPGILGGIIGALIIASYGATPLSNASQISYLPFYPQAQTHLNSFGRTFYQQAGCQLAGVCISMGLGIAFGVLAGYLMRIVYAFKPEQFYEDHLYFEGLDDQQHSIQKNHQALVEQIVD